MTFTKVRYTAILFFLANSFVASAQDSTELKWLRDHVFEVENINPENEDYSDLEFLIPILEEKEIILLGEEEHTFATTFEAKSRLIKFLHERLGVSVIAFEYDLFAMWKINQIEYDSSSSFLPIQNYIYPFWGKTTSTKELFNYVRKTQDSSKPINYIGFDGQITNQFDLTENLIELLKKDESEILEYKNFEKFKKVFQKHYGLRMDNLNLENYALFLMFIDDIIFYLELKEEKSQEDLVISQALKNVKKEMLNKIAGEPTEGYQVGIFSPEDSTYGFLGDMRSMGIYNRRDKLMAENIKWIKEVLYPDKKIVVWGHSEHTMYNRNKIKKDFPPDFPFHLRFTYGYNFKSMGSYLKESYGVNIYSIGFSTMSGKVDYSKNASNKFISNVTYEKENIEEKIIQFDINYPFIDFSSTRNEIPHSLFNSNMASNILGGNKTIGNISNHFDGILFIRNAKPIQYLKNY